MVDNTSAAHYIVHGQEEDSATPGFSVQTELARTEEVAPTEDEQNRSSVDLDQAAQELSPLQTRLLKEVNEPPIQLYGLERDIALELYQKIWDRAGEQNWPIPHIQTAIDRLMVNHQYPGGLPFPEEYHRYTLDPSTPAVTGASAAEPVVQGPEEVQATPALPAQTETPRMEEAPIPVSTETLVVEENNNVIFQASTTTDPSIQTDQRSAFKPSCGAENQPTRTMPTSTVPVDEVTPTTPVVTTAPTTPVVTTTTTARTRPVRNINPLAHISFHIGSATVTVPPGTQTLPQTPVAINAHTLPPRAREHQNVEQQTRPHVHINVEENAARTASEHLSNAENNQQPQSAGPTPQSLNVGPQVYPNLQQMGGYLPQPVLNYPNGGAYYPNQGYYPQQGGQPQYPTSFYTARNAYATYLGGYPNVGYPPQASNHFFPGGNVQPTQQNWYPNQGYQPSDQAAPVQDVQQPPNPVLPPRRENVVPPVH